MIHKILQIPDSLREYVGGHRLVTETLVRRGINDLESAKRFLNPDAYTPASSYELPDMELGVTRIEDAIKKQ